MSARTSLICDSCGLPWMENSYRNAGVLRDEAAENGWHRQPGGMDLCPECWAARIRYRLRPEVVHGRTIQVPEQWRVPTGWGNGRFREDR